MRAPASTSTRSAPMSAEGGAGDAYDDGRTCHAIGSAWDCGFGLWSLGVMWCSPHLLLSVKK
jgi:hypothetical protein